MSSMFIGGVLLLVALWRLTSDGNLAYADLVTLIAIIVLMAVASVVEHITALKGTQARLAHCELHDQAHPEVDADKRDHQSNH